MRKLVLIFLFVLALDQYTKHLAQQHLQLGVPKPVIAGVFDLTLVHNPGAAFGMFANLPDTQRRIALACVTVLALGVVVWFGYAEAKNDHWFQCSLAGIVAGAIGNMIDRFRFDSVIDFLDVYYDTHHWPAFNVADSAISVGVTVLFLRMLFVPKNTPKLH